MSTHPPVPDRPSTVPPTAVKHDPPVSTFAGPATWEDAGRAAHGPIIEVVLYDADGRVIGTEQRAAD